MQLRTEVLKEHSKKQSEKIAAWVCKDSSRFTELLKLLFDAEGKVGQRTAWIVRLVATQHPEWIAPHLRQLLLLCRRPVHAAVKRNILGMLQYYPLPRQLQGLAATICFDLLAAAGIPVAIKVFAMTVLHNITLVQPALRHELQLVIEERLQCEKPAFRSRGLKILKHITGIN